MSIDLHEFNLNSERAIYLTQQISDLLSKLPAEQAWKKISKKILTNQDPFSLHLFIFSKLFPTWRDHPETAPAWLPDPTLISQANISHLMNELNLQTVSELHCWSIIHFETFWERIINQLNIVFHEKPKKTIDLNAGIEQPQWLVNAKLNISDSCFTAPSEKLAIIYQSEQDPAPTYVSYAELNRLANRVANSLIQHGFKPGAAIAIDMSMTIEAIAIYLGIIKMGGAVVSIADSFAPEEITARLHIANTTAIFTQDFILRNNKKIPLYEKIMLAQAPTAIVIVRYGKHLTLRPGDSTWEQFLSTNDRFNAHACDPMDHCHILFSSGTTANPKAIPWNHTTPIKAASDAYLYQNIKPEDILAWPTNLGWMMGAWLIFSAFINQACIAIFDGTPNTTAFGKFIQETKVTMLGVIPSLVATWRKTGCMQNLDWQSIKAFSSSGECSNPEDMFYLMYLAGYKPIIEYCGGTEIGGAYITSTLAEKNYPSLFTTPALGTDFILIDEQGQPTNDGEIALLPPPFLGLSTELLNANHHDIYYAGMPTLNNQLSRRHGDHIRLLENGLYVLLGRVDDTMNLGGIKVSAAEIERAFIGLEDITETAAVAISSDQKPSLLVIYAATERKLDKEILKKQMQARINEHLNPLFKIHDVVLVNELPKTATQKIMRRLLRTQYSVR